jgi:acyl carrier protein
MTEAATPSSRVSREQTCSARVGGAPVSKFAIAGFASRVVMGGNTVSSSNEQPPADDPALREILKRCSPATYYAACKFRAQRAPADLRTMVLGVIERFVERDHRSKLAGAADAVGALKLSQDLGLDSLTMMEIVMVAEEVLEVSISNEELTRLRTIDDVHEFIASKALGPTKAARGKACEPVEPWNLRAVGEQVRRIEAAGAAGAHRLVD